jgi:hypothetical protein
MRRKRMSRRSHRRSTARGPTCNLVLSEGHWPGPTLHCSRRALPASQRMVALGRTCVRTAHHALAALSTYRPSYPTPATCSFTVPARSDPDERNRTSSQAFVRCRKFEGGNGRAGEDQRKRPKHARQSGLDMIFIFPGPRQQFIEAVDGMPVDHAREHIAQVGVGFDAVEFAGLDQRADDCPSIAATVGRGLIVPGVRRAKSWSDIRFIH